MPETVLAIDPGTRKCGVAVMRRAGNAVLYQEIVPTERIAEAILPLIEQYAVETILLGNATHSGTVQSALGNTLPIVLVPEAYTTQRAKVRYLKENPPRNLLLRLLPLGLRTPERPFDDYVAVLLAEDYFAAV